MELKTDYKDSVYIGKKKYRIITNSDGTISFEDVTEYSEIGDDFGATDVNGITTAINELKRNMISIKEIPDDELDQWTVVE